MISRLTSNKPADSKKDGAEEHAGNGASMTGQIELLRDILFGEQNRATDSRFKEFGDKLDQHVAKLEARLAELEQKLGQSNTNVGVQTDKLADQITQMAAAHKAELERVRAEAQKALETQAAEFQAALDKARADHASRMDKLESEHHLAVNKMTTENRAEFEKVRAEHTQKAQALQSEALQGRESLKMELSTLIASLDEGKASRHDLGQMMLDIGQRLRTTNGGSAPASDQPARAKK